MGYYVLTSSQFNALPTGFMSTAEKAKKRSKKDGSSRIFFSSTPPRGFTSKQAISRRDAVILMEGSDWASTDPDFVIARARTRP